MTRWQPIETAPRDGRWVMTINVTRYGGISDMVQKLPSIAWWNGAAWNDGEDDLMPPTHWMPLPDPPSS